MNYHPLNPATTNPLKPQPFGRCDRRHGFAICHVAIAVVTATLVATNLNAAEFFPLVNTAQVVSEDGLVVAGHFQQFGEGGQYSEAYRWTEDTGFVRLGFLPGDNRSELDSNRPGMSGDGSTIVGTSIRMVPEIGGSDPEAFIHTEAGGMRGLGDLPGGRFSSTAAAASFDGAVVVGTGRGENGSEAFRWTESTGMVGLGLLPGTSSSHADDISADGSIIVGLSSQPGPSPRFQDVFIWTAATGMQGLGLDGSAWQGITVSADGSVVGGGARISPASNYEAFIWTEETGATELGWLPGTADDDGTDHSAVSGISGNAAAVGWSGRTRDRRRGFVWNEQSGMQDLKQVLIDRHGLASSLEGWTLRAALDISANGRFIVGNGFNPDGEDVGWLVRLDTSIIPEPSGLALAAIGSLMLPFNRRGSALRGN